MTLKRVLRQDFGIGVVGWDSGRVTYHRNEGSAKAAKFAQAETWIDQVDKDQKNTKLAPGKRTKVWVADWNSDGKKDLLVGGVARIVSPSTESDEPSESKEQVKIHGFVRFYEQK